MLHSLCYVSNSVEKLDNEELQQLFNHTKKNNETSNISGILVYKDGNFLQIIEGEKAAIFDLYNKISKDKRHRNVIELVSETISERLFEDYHTGFGIIDNHEKINELQSYLSWLKAAEVESVNKIIIIIEKFIERKLV